jgi:ribonuclease R
MIGSRTGETWRLGDTVEVKLVEAQPFAGALRFELMSEGTIERGMGRKRIAAAMARNKVRGGPSRGRKGAPRRN